MNISEAVKFLKTESKDKRYCQGLIDAYGFVRACGHVRAAHSLEKHMIFYATAIEEGKMNDNTHAGE